MRHLPPVWRGLKNNMDILVRIQEQDSYEEDIEVVMEHEAVWPFMEEIIKDFGICEVHFGNS